MPAYEFTPDTDVKLRSLPPHSFIRIEPEEIDKNAGHPHVRLYRVGLVQVIQLPTAPTIRETMTYVFVEVIGDCVGPDAYFQEVSYSSAGRRPRPRSFSNRAITDWLFNPHRSIHRRAAVELKAAILNRIKQVATQP